MLSVISMTRVYHGVRDPFLKGIAKSKRNLLISNDMGLPILYLVSSILDYVLCGVFGVKSLKHLASLRPSK